MDFSDVVELFVPIGMFMLSLWVMSHGLTHLFM